MSDYLKKGDIMALLRNAHPVVDGAKAGEHLAAEIAKQEEETKRVLRVDDPYGEHRDIFHKAQKSLQQGDFGRELVVRDLASYRRLAEAQGNDIPDYSFWEKRIGELWAADKENKPIGKEENFSSKTGMQKTMEETRKKLMEEQKIFRGLLQKKWGQMLDEARAKWRLEIIEKFRQELLKRLAEWLELLQNLAEAMRDFSFEPGLLFDLSKGKLTLSDIEEMKKWADYLRDDAEMRRLCELLGRMRRTAQSKRREWIETMEKFTEIRPDVNSREEYSGIRLGNSIEHALPQEKALLADAETSLLFDVKFVENRLMQFDTAGWVQHEMERAKKIETEVTEEEKKGPLIVCVDTSASMQGAPETIGKAVTLYLATEAMRQKRNCFLINFSTGIETLDLSRPGSFRDLIGFLQKSFRGGTDAEPALRCSVEMLRTKDYKNADVLAISDFVMGDFSDEILNSIAETKKSKTRFFSLTIRDESSDKKAPDFFDRDWRYIPGKGTEELGAKELLNIAEEAGEEMNRLPD